MPLQAIDCDMILAELEKFGATLTDMNYLRKGDKTLQVKVRIKGNRIRFDDINGLIASYPFKVGSVTDFINKYYFWEQSK